MVRRTAQKRNNKEKYPASVSQLFEGVERKGGLLRGEIISLIGDVRANFHREHENLQKDLDPVILNCKVEDLMLGGRVKGSARKVNKVFGKKAQYGSDWSSMCLTPAQSNVSTLLPGSHLKRQPVCVRKALPNELGMSQSGSPIVYMRKDAIEDLASKSIRDLLSEDITMESIELLHNKLSSLVVRMKKTDCSKRPLTRGK